MLACAIAAKRKLLMSKLPSIVSTADIETFNNQLREAVESKSNKQRFFSICVRSTANSRTLFVVNML